MDESPSKVISNVSEAAVIEYVAYFMGLDKREITSELRLREDLKIDGHDAKQFIRVFSLRYGVDVSTFGFNDYFHDGDELSFLRSLTSIIIGKRPLKTLRIKDLMLAAEQKILPPKTESYPAHE